MSRKMCQHTGCKRKVPSNILNNPQGEPLCALHHGFQVRLNEDRIKCTMVECSNMAQSNGLCKNHTHNPREPRMDLRIEHSDARQERLEQILGPVLKNRRRLDELNMSDFNCLYCGDNAHSSMGPSPPHCCPVCWTKIEKIN